MPVPLQSGEAPVVSSQFTTTHWSVVLRASDFPAPQTEAAMETLCRKYWYPLYAYLRRHGYDGPDAQDLVQGFFVRLLERKSLEGVEPAKAKFRSFLLVALNRFVVNERERALAAKRGGGKSLVPLDNEEAERLYLAEPASDLTPERIYDKRWALAVLDGALARLRSEFLAAGKARHFEELKVFLSDEASEGDYAAVGKRLDLTPNALAVAVHRLRQRYRELVRAEIAHTVSSATAIDDELHYLFAVIGG